MTSPAELANQVRAGIPDVITVHPPGECPYCDALAALSVLEELLEQTEKALRLVGDLFALLSVNQDDESDYVYVMRSDVRRIEEAIDALVLGVVGETSGTKDTA